MYYWWLRSRCILPMQSVQLPQTNETEKTAGNKHITTSFWQKARCVFKKRNYIFRVQWAKSYSSDLWISWMVTLRAFVNRMGLIIGYSNVTKRGYCNNYLSGERYSLPYIRRMCVYVTLPYFVFCSSWHSVRKNVQTCACVSRNH